MGECECTQSQLESFAAACDDDVSMAMVQRVAKHLCCFDSASREWRVRPECAWLLSDDIGHKLATFVRPRARSRTRKKRSRAEASGGEDVDPEPGGQEAPYTRYASCEHYLPSIARATGVNHTDAVRRKARKPGKCAKASTKQRISTFFALHGVQRDDFAGSTSAQSNRS